MGGLPAYLELGELHPPIKLRRLGGGSFRVRVGLKYVQIDAVNFGI